MNRDLSAYDKTISKSDVLDYARSNKSVALNSSELSVLLILFVCFLFLPLGILFNNNITSSFMMIVFVCFLTFFFIMIAFAFWEIFSNIIRIRIYLSQIAKLNELQYLPNGSDRVERAGFIFNIGHSKLFKNMLISDSSDKYEIANYQYTVGSGKNQRTVGVGYIVIELDRSLPHMVLDSKKNNFNLLGLSISNLPVSFKKDQVLSLEGNFDSYFTLYAPKDYETDALYIFNPALMALFIDETSNYDAEIIDDNLYIYSSKAFDFTKRETLQNIFKVIDTVMIKTTNSTKRYRDERVDGGFDSNVVHSSGAKLRQNLRWLPVFVFILYLIFIILRMFVD